MERRLRDLGFTVDQVDEQADVKAASDVLLVDHASLRDPAH
ncbi:hypothetical protein [Breoghania sp.]|nr:hypothetical protein [Breoghania sp.]MDJ0930387.1 hypothetical protein [Breoghania sp.]